MRRCQIPLNQSGTQLDLNIYMAQWDGTRLLVLYGTIMTQMHPQDVEDNLLYHLPKVNWRVAPHWTDAVPNQLG